jgi:hypothetical protein
LTLDRDQVVEYIGKLDHEAKAIRKESLRLAWYMRGGLSYDDAMLLSQQEREIIGEIVKSNLETTKESGQPFF